jgi:hypothetical protein
LKSFLSRRIQSPKTGDTTTLEQYLKDISIEIKIDAKNKLEEKIKKIESNDFSLQGNVLYGNPAEEIITFSQSEKTILNLIKLLFS